MSDAGTPAPGRIAADAAALDSLGEALDHVMTIDVAARGAIGELYRAARQRFGAPLSTAAASELAKAIEPGRAVLLCTGFPVRPWISPAIGETDGPPGVAALAWGLIRGLGAAPVALGPEPMLGQIEAAMRAGGVHVVPRDELLRACGGPRPSVVAAVEPLTCSAPEAPEAASRLLGELSPAALLAVEHPGANLHGVHHSSTGVDISAATAKADVLFAAARKLGILTMSFADMPNEIGLGILRGEAVDRIPYASRCQCPCGGGIAGAGEVDRLVMATTANWGAYATMAALGVLLDRADVHFTPEQDARAIAATLGAGAMEGLSGSGDPQAGVDGIPTVLSGRVVELLSAVAHAHAGLAGRHPF